MAVFFRPVKLFKIPFLYNDIMMFTNDSLFVLFSTNINRNYYI